MKKILPFLLSLIFSLSLTAYTCAASDLPSGMKSPPAADVCDAYSQAIAAAQCLIEEQLQPLQDISFPQNIWEYAVEQNGEEWEVYGYVKIENSLGNILKKCWKTSFSMKSTGHPQKKGPDGDKTRERPPAVIITQSLLQKAETILFLLLNIFMNYSSSARLS